MFKKLRESFKDKTREKLCNHLVNLGIDAEMAEKGASEDIGKTSLFTPVKYLPLFPHPLKGRVSDIGSIRITGKEIDVIQVTRYTSTGQGGGTRTYEIDYAVKGHIEGKEERVMAKTKLKKKGFIRKKVLDISWTGGEIADLLNEDQSLKELMLQEQIPNFGNIKIKPDKNRPYIRIHTSMGAFPSEKAFECYNTIAKHIRKLL